MAANPRPAAQAIGPIETTKLHQAHANADTLAAVEIFNGMVKAKLLPLFPPDLPAAEVRATLVAELDHSVEYAKAGKAQKKAVVTKETAEKAGEKLLRRCVQLVDSAYPLGSEKRADFFPSGPGPHSLAAELEAMAQGVAGVGLPLLPEGITAESIAEAAESVADVADTREAHGKVVTQVAGEKRALRPVITDIRRRLTKALRGFFGEESPKLVPFGLKPLERKGGGRKKMTKAEKAASAAKRAAEKKAKAGK